MILFFNANLQQWLWVAVWGCWTRRFRVGLAGAGEHGAHGDEHGGHGHATIEKDTGITPRRCTDTQCCFAWLMFTLLLMASEPLERNMGFLASCRVAC